MDLENSVMFTSKFYVKVWSFAYNSAATDQKLFIFGMRVPGGGGGGGGGGGSLPFYIYGPLGHAPGRG